MTNSATLLQKLLDPTRIIVFDGAMGTMLYAKGVFINQCYDELNLRAPELIRAIHEEYVRAGAEVLETNTFGANRVKLEQHGLADQVRDINIAATKLAREAAGDVALVAGAVQAPTDILVAARSLSTLAGSAESAIADPLPWLEQAGRELAGLPLADPSPPQPRASAAAR